MTISQYVSKPQGTRTNAPTWEQKTDKSTGEITRELVAYRYIMRDLLTNRAYFDARNLTPLYQPIKMAKERAYTASYWREYRLDVHADMLKIKAQEALTGLSLPPVGGGKRGTVRGFSRQSRKRMIEFMASTRPQGHLLFSTFTYPDEFPVGQPGVWIADFEALRRRIERRFPEWSIIWRKELKKRRSGNNKGKLAPHYHMIIDTGVNGASVTVEHVQNRGKWHEKTVSGVSKLFESWALQNWAEIVDSNDPNHATHGNFTVACRNKRHAYKYVSKYVAKVDFDEYEVGRRWGRIGQWDTDASESLFLTKKEYIELMRLVVRWMKSKGQDYAKQLAKMKRTVGCTLFGLGDLARSGDLFKRMINHASVLAGELPQIE